MSRRWLIADTCLLAAGIVLAIFRHDVALWFLHITGSTNETGRWYAFWSGFGSDIGEVTVVGALGNMTRRAAQAHVQLLAQNAKHHKERLAQAAGHHKEHLRVLREQHRAQLAQADEHHEALKAHLTEQLSSKEAA